MAKINLPSHVPCGLFFALHRIGGVRHGPIHHSGHHGQRRSVFKRLAPRVRRNASNEGPGPFGRLFDCVVRGIRTDAAKVENRTEISRTEPHRFLNLTRSIPYFSDKFGFGSKFGVLNSNSERSRFKVCSTGFHISILYSEFDRFQIRSKPNLQIPAVQS